MTYGWWCCCGAKFSGSHGDCLETLEQHKLVCLSVSDSEKNEIRARLMKQAISDVGMKPISLPREG